MTEIGDELVCATCNCALEWPFFWTTGTWREPLPRNYCPACFDQRSEETGMFAARGLCIAMDCAQLRAPGNFVEHCRSHKLQLGYIALQCCKQCRPSTSASATSPCMSCLRAAHRRQHRDYKRMGTVDELAAKLAALAEFESLGYSYERLAHLVSMDEIAKDCERADYVHDDGDI